MTTPVYPTLADVSLGSDKSAMRVVWTGVSEANTFAAVSMPGYSQRSIHVSGTFGGATVTLNGSNTGVNFFGLNNLQGTAFSVTAEGLSQVQEGVTYYQPSAASGSGQSLTVTMLFTGPRHY